MAVGFVCGGKFAGRPAVAARGVRRSSCSVSSRRRFVVRASTVQDRGELQILEDTKLNKFFIVDEQTKEQRELDLKEKEYLFLDALYAYGAESENPILSDEQFDLLKEDLTWEGSRVMLLNDKEKMFLEAARAYYRKQPIMSDDEFDNLRQELVLEGSSVAVSRGPKCSLQTQLCTTDCEPDTQRMLVTYLPAAGIGALLWAAISFEIPVLRNVNTLYSLIGGLPIIALFAQVTTRLAFPPPGVILTGACPNCGEEVRCYFGDILSVKGPTEEAMMKCGACKAEVTFRMSTRKLEINAAAKQ